MEPQTADLYESNIVRVLDARGEIVAYTGHGTDWATAFENFTQTAIDSEPGYMVQLIVDDRITEEYVAEELYVEPADA